MHRERLGRGSRRVVAAPAQAVTLATPNQLMVPRRRKILRVIEAQTKPLGYNVSAIADVRRVAGQSSKRQGRRSWPALRSLTCCYLSSSALKRLRWLNSGRPSRRHDARHERHRRNHKRDEGAFIASGSRCHTPGYAATGSPGAPAPPREDAEDPRAPASQAPGGSVQTAFRGFTST